jgi:hypothetical protein
LSLELWDRYKPKIKYPKVLKVKDGELSSVPDSILKPSDVLWSDTSFNPIIEHSKIPKK